MKQSLFHPEMWSGWAAGYGAIVMSLGISTLLGRLFGLVSLYKFSGDDPGMAINTAIASLFTGFAIVCLAYRQALR